MRQPPPGAVFIEEGDLTPGQRGNMRRQPHPCIPGVQGLYVPPRFIAWDQRRPRGGWDRPRPKKD